jgi:hypothetical protein
MGPTDIYQVENLDLSNSIHYRLTDSNNWCDKYNTVFGFWKYMKYDIKNSSKI